MSQGSEPPINPYSSSQVTTSATNVPMYDHLGAKADTWLVMLLVLAILQIVFGLMELVMGIFFVGYGFFLPTLFAEIAKQNPAGQAPPQALTQGMAWYFGIMGVLMLLLSVLRIVSGVYLFNMKGRMLSIVSLCVGLISIGTFYCACTSIPLAVIGLIVLLHPVVKYAFQLRASGLSTTEVRNHFARATAKA